MKQTAQPGPFQQASKLVAAGRLFELSDWLKNRENASKISSTDWCALLKRSIATGFHSMVKVILDERTWTAEELHTAVHHLFWNKQYALAELLFAAGADPSAVSFESVASSMDGALMEKMLRAGVDPCCENGFAKALHYHKAKPLLGFYRRMRGEFPALDAQAALALQMAVQDEDLRLISLLRWAGADPFKPVPMDLSGSWDEESCIHTAASAACWRSEETFKTLKIGPSVEQAVDLLSHAAWHAVPTILRQLLSFIPQERINHTEKVSCEALGELIRWEYRDYFGGSGSRQENEERRIECVEMLVDHGARWVPKDDDQIRYTRHGLGRNTGRYVVRIVRLLLYTPGASEPGPIWELCRTEKMRAVIKSADPALWNELSEFAAT